MTPRSVACRSRRIPRRTRASDDCRARKHDFRSRRAVDMPGVGVRHRHDVAFDAFHTPSPNAAPEVDLMSPDANAGDFGFASGRPGWRGRIRCAMALAAVVGCGDGAVDVAQGCGEHQIRVDNSPMADAAVSAGRVRCGRRQTVAASAGVSGASRCGPTDQGGAVAVDTGARVGHRIVYWVPAATGRESAENDFGGQRRVDVPRGEGIGRHAMALDAQHCAVSGSRLHVGQMCTDAGCRGICVAIDIERRGRAGDGCALPIRRPVAARAQGDS